MSAEAVRRADPSPPPLGKGLVYKGKWRVLHPLTETDRSYVFLGTPLQGGAPVAIKVLKERRARDTRFMRLHHADMQAATSLPRHPGLVPVLDAGWTNGRYVVVSQFAAGEPLSTRLEKPRPLPYHLVLAATRQVVAMLSFANQAGIRFRQVELDHLILDEEKREVRLLRFSLPRSARVGVEPPRGVGPDLHMAGNLLYRLLCGHLPPARATRPGGAEVLMDELKKRVASAYPEVSPDEVHDLVTVYLRSTTRDQARRFSSYAELDAALAGLEESYRPLREERRRREQEDRRSSLFATAYDTVLALQGGAREAEDEDDGDLRERRIQVMLFAASGLAFLILAWSLFAR